MEGKAPIFIPYTFRSGEYYVAWKNHLTRHHKEKGQSLKRSSSVLKKSLSETFINQKASYIYHNPGFENLSHFLFTFKKLFGLTPGELTEQKKTP